MKIIGIDPGLSGAVACLDVVPGGFDVLQVLDCPVFRPAKGSASVNDAELARLLRGMCVAPAYAFLERAQAFPRMGGSGAFNYGANYGCYRGILATLGIPLTLASPAKWKQVLRVSKDKDMCRRRASELFPRHAEHFARKKDDGRAEAALIAWYGALQLGLVKG